MKIKENLLAGAIVFASVSLGLLAGTANAADKAVTPGIVEWVNPGWSAEESTISNALSIIMKDMNMKSVFKFTPDWSVKADLEWHVTDGSDLRRQIAARYVAEKETLQFPIDLTYRLNVEYKSSVRLLDPAILATNQSFADLAHHELGHALMDCLSRKAGLGPWFTVADFERHSRSEQLGMNIISEGTAVYIQRKLQARDDRPTELSFPENYDNAPGYTFDMIAYEGGYWLVQSILDKYGETGLVWLLKHPFVATNDLRASAVSYRKQALAELASAQR